MYSALVALLAGCGGGDAEVPALTPAPKPAIPAPPTREEAAEAPVLPPVAPTPAPPASAPPAPAPADWEAIWREDWSAPIFGGWVRHSLLRCNGQADTNMQRAREFQTAGATWSYFSSSAGSAWPDGGALRIKGYSAGAVLGWETFDHTRPMRVTATIDVARSSGSWVGLTLIQDETDYREIALEWYEDGLYVELYAPCYSRRLERVAPGARELTLEYVPDEGWWYIVDGEDVHFEPITNLGAALVGDPRVGIYWHVHKGGVGPVEATVGPVVVERR